MTSRTCSLAGRVLVLAVDMSSTKGSLALGHVLDANLEILAERSWEKRAMHSDVATLELQALLADSGKKLSELTHIIVNHGPGSFTGLRVGINLARTLAYAFDLPILGVGTLELLAYKNSAKGETVCVAVKALQVFAYAGVFKNLGTHLEVVQAPASVEVSDLQNFAEQADSSITKTKILADSSLSLDQCPASFIDPLTNARMSLEYYSDLGRASQFLSWKEILPIYIRASEPEEKMRRGLLKPV